MTSCHFLLITVILMAVTVTSKSTALNIEFLNYVSSSLAAGFTCLLNLPGYEPKCIFNYFPCCPHQAISCP